jgi:glycosyltransferase involved in cell wall biosynthesis
MKRYVPFSVITPSYNRIDELKRAIGSVRGQQRVRIEHIVQDNCSTDGTVEFLGKFGAEVRSQKSETSSNFRSSTSDVWSAYTLSYASERDTGMYHAINLGWGKASGEILSWLNCDEQYLPGTLEKVQFIFDQYPDVDVVYGNAIIVDTTGAPVSARRDLALNKFFITNTFLNIFSCTCFFRRALWDRGLLHLDENYRYASDLDLILRLLTAGVRSCYLNEYLSLFQVDGGNLSTHQQMKDETASIQQKFGAGSPVVRKAVRGIRWGLRALNGHYFPQRVSYEYALDERPSYKRVAGTVKGTFKLIQKTS